MLQSTKSNQRNIFISFLCFLAATGFITHICFLLHSKTENLRVFSVRGTKKMKMANLESTKSFTNHPTTPAFSLSNSFTAVSGFLAEWSAIMLILVSSSSRKLWGAHNTTDWDDNTNIVRGKRGVLICTLKSLGTDHAWLQNSWLSLISWCS